MLEKVTLLIPTHNRHDYLERILNYYADVNMKIIIADSTGSSFYKYPPSNKIAYLHFPGEKMPKKLSIALANVETDFVVICADDDFILPAGISRCLSFLEENPAYIAAQGHAIAYHKSFLSNENINFAAMQKAQLKFNISDNDIYKRLDHAFNPYRAFFSAVYRTPALQMAYNDKINIENLFLNEYLSVVIPLALGKLIELPVFYQVRENALDSGDKTTVNLDIILEDEKYFTEYEKYLNYIISSIAINVNIDKVILAEKLDFTFRKFAKYLKEIKEKTKAKLPFKKKIGKVINFIPFFGNLLIKKNREIERMKYLDKIVITNEDKQELNKIEKIIKKYANTIK